MSNKNLVFILLIILPLIFLLSSSCEEEYVPFSPKTTTQTFIQSASPVNSNLSCFSIVSHHDDEPPFYPMTTTTTSSMFAMGTSGTFTTTTS